MRLACHLITVRIEYILAGEHGFVEAQTDDVSTALAHAIAGGEVEGVGYDTHGDPVEQQFLLVEDLQLHYVSGPLYESS